MKNSLQIFILLRNTIPFIFEKKLVLVIIAIFSFSNIDAQLESKSYTIPAPVKVKLSDIKDDWKPSLQNMEMPVPGSTSKRGKLLELKEINENKYPRKKKKTKDGIQKSGDEGFNLYIEQAFKANNYMNRVPNDNDLAINNDGQLISVINSSILIYDTNADTVQVQQLSFEAFASVLEIPNSKFDPRVLYDAENDKFILMMLNGFAADNSKIIFGFSETNDATGLWNLYAIPGNPLNNNRWSDFPMIVMTDKYVFLTINLIIPDVSWQEGFEETIVWQINKESGYTGQELQTFMYQNFTYEDKPLRNLCPIKNGTEKFDSELYFLSNRNFAESNDTIFLVHLQGEGDDAEIIVKPVISPQAYFVPPQARQPENRFFDTNDARVLSALKQNNKIQFVQNCLDTATGNASILHGIIEDFNTENPTMRAVIFSDTLEYGYPNISYIGSGDESDQTIITVNHSSSSVYSGWSAFVYNNDGEYSERFSVKEGINYVLPFGVNTSQRWGDYMGSQRKYNEEGVVWAVGSFGNIIRRHDTWVARLSLNKGFPASQTNISNKANSVKVFPNPSLEFVNIEFRIEKPENLNFNLYDLQGKLVKKILNEHTKKGMNNFSFTINPLPAGIYILQIESKDQLISSQKIIKQ
jgi:hypothetical protein